MASCFDKMKMPGKKGQRAICKGCAQDFVDIAARLREHAEKCPRLTQKGLWKSKQQAQSWACHPNPGSGTALFGRAPLMQMDLNMAMMKVIVAHHLPFKLADCPILGKLVNLLRPGLSFFPGSVCHLHLPQGPASPVEGS